MRYDLEYLSRKHAFDEILIEKVCRISDILQEISKLDFLRNRLSFYGGTALNFIYFKISRLSVDLDFNYRHINEKDWGLIRDDIDKRLKIILEDQGYSELAIQPTYPMCRMEVKYKNSKGLPDFLRSK